MKVTETKPWLQYYTDEMLSMELPEMSIMDYLLWRTKERKQKTALNYLDVEISMDEMIENIYATANAYKGIGVKKGDYIVVVAATMPEIVYTFYALSLIGAVPNMVDPRFTVDGIRGCITEVDAKCVVTILNSYDKVTEAIKGTNVNQGIVLSPAHSLSKIKQKLYGLKNPMPKTMPEGFMDWDTFMKHGEGVKVEPIHDRANECCLIVHTGGTTGRSKSVMLSDNNINNVSWQYLKNPIRTVNTGYDVYLDVMPPFIAYGFGYGIHLPLCGGMVSVIIPSLDPEELGKLILKYKPQDIAGVPYHYQILMKDKRLKGKDLSYLVKPCAGGDAVAVPVEEEINVWLKEHNCKYNLQKGYGMTELSAVATVCALDHNKVGSVGFPHADFLVAAFDPDTYEELDAGETGEICVCGPTMMMGYYNNQEETDKLIKVHKDGLKWVHTGDFGYVDEEGFVFIKGRLKRMFMDWFGFKVFPTAIEDAVALTDDIEYCCAVGVRDLRYPRGYVPYVFYTTKAGSTKSEADINEDIKKNCKAKLAEYMMPAYFKKIDAMPRTPVGKTDYRKLEDTARAEIHD